MDFDLSKPQKLLKQSARDLLARDLGTGDLWQDIADQGWTGLIVAESHGGLGLGVVELAAVVEETGRVCMPGPFLSTVFASAVLSRMGTEVQRSRWLEPIALGKIRATVAILEETASWSLDAIQSRASPNGVTLEKCFVSDADEADLILVVARSAGELGDELAVLPVERNAAGLSIRRTPSMDESRTLCVVGLDDYKLRPDDVLRGDASGLSAAIDVATVALCAEMVGGMQWVLDATVGYAKTRQQFGRPIGSFQAVQHQCADMLLLTESSRSATYYAAWTLTHDEAAAPIAVSIAKAYCSDAFREVANRGVQVHGGIGFTWEHALQHYYKRGKASETLFGDATFHRERIARFVLDPAPVERPVELVVAR
jgi:alkylation response protein AidB-like acyl-CoA dehydrogenase